MFIFDFIEHLISCIYNFLKEYKRDKYRNIINMHPTDFAATDHIIRIQDDLYYLINYLKIEKVVDDKGYCSFKKIKGKK